MNKGVLARRNRHDQLRRRQGLAAGLAVAAIARGAVDDRDAAKRKTARAKVSGDDRLAAHSFACWPCLDSQSAGFKDLDSCPAAQIRQRQTGFAQRETVFASTEESSGCHFGVYHRCPTQRQTRPRGLRARGILSVCPAMIRSMAPFLVGIRW